MVESAVTAVLTVLVAPKLATVVVEATVNGAVPVATVEVMTPDAEMVVNAPVVGVVAPTVPLMLMEAVPVRLVTVPLLGVPRAPLNVTGAPAEPIAIPRAVATPVPSPDTPVDIGNPVALVKVPLDGVPRAPPLTTNDPAVPTATPRAVTTPVPVVTVLGAAPAPPPTIRALAANAALVAQVVPLLKYGIPPLVPATVNARVPLDVIGEPATEIKPPVKDCATLVTVPPGLLDAMLIPPAEFVIVMLDPAVNVVRVNPVPLPMSKAPFAGVVDNPVPPFATAKVPVKADVGIVVLAVITLVPLP